MANDNDIVVSDTATRSKQFTRFLDFKTRSNYLDLPDENYKPSLLVQVLETMNKLTMTVSSFALVWFVVLVSRVYLGLFFYTAVMLGLLLVLAGIVWQAIEGKLGIKSLIAVFASLVVSILFWFVQVN